MDQHVRSDSELVFPDSVAAGTDEQKFSRYIKWVGGILSLGSVLIMLLVVVVDPYYLFRIVDVAGFNRIKPLPLLYRNEIKLAQAKAVRPNVLLLGNSRIEVGFDPASAQLKAQSYSAYNLALAGTSLGVAENMLGQMRSAAPPPALTIVGLEFLDFLVSPAKSEAPATKPDTELYPWKWRFDTLFSIKSVSDSALTLRLQKMPDPETMTTRGHTPLFEYNRYARNEGYHAIFRQRAQENAKSLVRRPHSLYGADGRSGSLENLRRMLTTMAHDGTQAHLVIYPYHAELMTMFSEAGLDPIMEEWKNVLVREIETVRSRYPDARITLWDFSGYGTVQCEAIPRPGDTRSVTRFYWEAGHFKSSVGELMLERILGKQTHFGLALTAGNLEQNRQRITAELEQCRSIHPEVFADARSLISAARK